MDDRRMSVPRMLLREQVSCPLCEKRVSLHFLKYKHICKRPVEVTDESREQALQSAVVHLRRRLGES